MFGSCVSVSEAGIVGIVAMKLVSAGVIGDCSLLQLDKILPSVVKSSEVVDGEAVCSV